MPSGSKRRKNAKKKKDKKASISSTTSSAENEDLKHESDGEHNGEQPFTEGEEEEVTEKREDVISHVEENKSADVENHSERTDKLADKEGVVQIERESKLTDDFDNKRGGSSSSNSSSSDVESDSVGKDVSVVCNAPVIDNVEVVDSLTEVPIQISHTTPVSNIDDSVVEAVDDTRVEKVSSLHQSVPEGSDMIELELKESGESMLCTPEESDKNEQVVKVVDPEPKDEVTNAAEASRAIESATHDGEDKLMHAYNEPEGSSASINNNSLIFLTVELEPKGTGEKELSSVGESARPAGVVNDMAPEQNNDKVPNYAATLGAKESAAHDSEGTPAEAYNAPRDDVAKDMEHVNDSEVIGSSTGQAIGLRPVQTTSWKSCCGLFELFAGSNR